jgi:hypothetical protein
MTTLTNSHKNRRRLDFTIYRTTDGIAKIPVVVAKGKYVLVSDEDIDLIERKWTFRTYATQAGFEEGTSKMHIIIAKRMLGDDFRPELLVDHINGAKFDNRRCNLRQVSTGSINVSNRRKFRNSSSRYYWVSLCQIGVWRVCRVDSRWTLARWRTVL